MALAALSRSVVIHLRRVTGQTKGTGRNQRGDGSRIVAFVAAGVSVHRPGMGHRDLTVAVAARAVSSGRMVVAVTGGAGCHARVRPETHGHRVAAYAGNVLVLRMLELDRVRPGSLPGHCDCQRGLARGRQLVIGMT